MTTETAPAPGVAAKPGEDKPAVPPYISFLTFTNCIEWLEREGVPHRFDRSFWSRKFAGNVGPYVVGALRFLKLLQGDTPQSPLEGLVNAKGDERKAAMREVFRKAYSAIEFELLPKATPGMLSEWLGQYGLDGDTKRKAQSFLINALKYTDTPMSPALKKLARNKPAGASRVHKPKEGDSVGAANPPENGAAGEAARTPLAGAKSQALTKSLDARGTELKLSFTFDLVKLATDPEGLKLYQELMAKFTEVKNLQDTKTSSSRE